MKKFSIFGKELISWGKPEATQNAPSISQKDPMPRNLPAKRTSIANRPPDSYQEKGNTDILQASYVFEIIPLLRKLVYVNPNLSQALDNVIELGNTGHTIKFDAAVSEDQINKMRAHLDSKKKEWSESVAGMDGLVNKMISQIMISGALSNEWVPNISLTGIKTVALVNPELIRWGYNKGSQTYEAYQYVDGLDVPKAIDNLVKLNPHTFKYYALKGDTDKPYGIPPYWSGLDSIKTQRLMMDNIKFIIEQVGIMGFLEVMLEKPEQLPSESYEQYGGRLDKFLQEAKKRVQEGLRDGVSVGYKDDTEFKFNSTTKDLTGLKDVFELNELALSSGIKMDASMLGRSYGSSEAQITVIFTKLISQLTNIQNLVKANLEYGYALELRLAGFKFNNLNVIFNASTALDRLKDAQADEIKIRNNNALYLDGIISQEQYAHNMGYEKPNQAKPRFLRGGVQTEAEINQKREADKNASAKKTREKGKAREKPISKQ